MPSTVLCLSRTSASRPRIVRWLIEAVLPANIWKPRLRPLPASRRGATCSFEPRLQQMLDDPIVQDIMKSDGVSRRDIEVLFVRAELAAERKAA